MIAFILDSAIFQLAYQLDYLWNLEDKVVLSTPINNELIVLVFYYFSIRSCETSLIFDGSLGQASALVLKILLRSCL